jgi:lipoprotein-releasing system permease protein
MISKNWRLEDQMLPFRLAVRFLKAGRGQTILIITGISIAVAAQIFVGLLINSLQLTIINRTIGNQPQITISSATDDVRIADWSGPVEMIGDTEMVEVVSVSASGNAFVQKGIKTSPVLLRGMDSNADDIYRFTDSLYSGEMANGHNEVIIGKELQEEYEYNLGNELAISVPGDKTATYLITGFFDLGVQQLNRSWIITDIETTQNLFGYGDAVTDIEIGVTDYFKADSLAASIATMLDNPALKVSNWKDENEQLLSGLQGQSISSLMIQIFIVVSVVIAISAILAITVFQKSRQLGILKAMGLKDRSASLIFIFEGLIIGLIGSVIGVILGLGLLYGFNAGTSQSGSPALIDLYIDPWFIILSWGIAILASVIAALVPARRSLRLNPIDVIREG